MTGSTKRNSLNLNVRVSGALRAHVEHAVTEGDYENVSEYVRDLIRRDKERSERSEQAAFAALKAHLQAAFDVDESEARIVTADDIRRQAAHQIGQ